MDGKRFDDLSKVLGTAVTRQSVFQLLAGIGAAGMAALTGSDLADAKNKGGKGKGGHARKNDHKDKGKDKDHGGGDVQAAGKRKKGKGKGRGKNKHKNKKKGRDEGSGSARQQSVTCSEPSNVTHDSGNPPLCPGGIRVNSPERTCKTITDPCGCKLEWCVTLGSEGEELSFGPVAGQPACTVESVVVKGGNQGANIYDFDPPAFCADGLTTPTDQDISHFDLCGIACCQPKTCDDFPGECGRQDNGCGGQTPDCRCDGGGCCDGVCLPGEECCETDDCEQQLCQNRDCVEGDCEYTPVQNGQQGPLCNDQGESCCNDGRTCCQNGEFCCKGKTCCRDDEQCNNDGTCGPQTCEGDCERNGDCPDVENCVCNKTQGSQSGTCGEPQTCGGDCENNGDCPDVENCVCNKNHGADSGTCGAPEICEGTCANNRDCLNLDDCVCNKDQGAESGTCGTPQTCEGTCESNGDCPDVEDCVCNKEQGAQSGTCGACVPLTCADFPGQCGPQDNGCGGQTASCTCPVPGDTCVEGVCVGCIPETKEEACQDAGRVCGLVSDGCGGEYDCGACSATQTCIAGVCLARGGKRCKGTGKAGHPCKGKKCKCKGKRRCHNRRCCETKGDGSRHCNANSDCCPGLTCLRKAPGQHKVCLRKKANASSIAPTATPGIALGAVLTGLLARGASRLFGAANRDAQIALSDLRNPAEQPEV